MFPTFTLSCLRKDTWITLPLYLLCHFIQSQHSSFWRDFSSDHCSSHAAQTQKSSRFMPIISDTFTIAPQTAVLSPCEDPPQLPWSVLFQYETGASSFHHLNSCLHSLSFLVSSWKRSALLFLLSAICGRSPSPPQAFSMHSQTFLLLQALLQADFTSFLTEIIWGLGVSQVAQPGVWTEKMWEEYTLWKKEQ